MGRRSVPAIVSITGLALGRTIAPIGLTAVRTVCRSPVSAHVGISAFAFGRAVVPFLHTAIFQSNVGVVAADVAVVGVSHLADRGTGRGIIFGAAVLPFVNPGRTNAVGIFAAAAVPGYRTRIRTVGRVVYIFALADAGLILSAAGSSLSDLI